MKSTTTTTAASRVPKRDDVEDRDQDGEGQRVLPQAMITKNA